MTHDVNRPLLPLHVLEHGSKERSVRHDCYDIETGIEEWDTDNPYYANDSSIYDAALRPVRLVVDERHILRLLELDLTRDPISAETLASYSTVYDEGIVWENGKGHSAPMPPRPWWKFFG